MVNRGLSLKVHSEDIVSLILHEPHTSSGHLGLSAGYAQTETIVLNLTLMSFRRRKNLFWWVPEQDT